MVNGVKNRMNFTCLDYHGAFVHSKMPDKFDVYIKAPYGIQVNENEVVKLKKSLYGTKNAVFIMVCCPKYYYI